MQGVSNSCSQIRDQLCPILCPIFGDQRGSAGSGCTCPTPGTVTVRAQGRHQMPPVGPRQPSTRRDSRRLLGSHRSMRNTVAPSLGARAMDKLGQQAPSPRGLPPLILRPPIHTGGRNSGQETSSGNIEQSLLRMIPQPYVEKITLTVRDLTQIQENP